jgi:lactate dehydrogenase-like 2-hydroxyacid dehydrogenase
MATVVSAVTLGAPHTDLLAGWDLAVVDLTTASDDELAGALRDTEVLLVNSHYSVDARVLGHAPKLRAISTVSVGFDHIDVEIAAHRAITVTTTPVLSDAVADLTLALITMTLRRLREATDDIGRGVWSNGLLGNDVRGKQLLLIGFGRIAREVAARALAAKMTVLAYDVRN